eukprot:311555_1
MYLLDIDFDEEKVNILQEDGSSIQCKSSADIILNDFKPYIIDKVYYIAVQGQDNEFGYYSMSMECGNAPNELSPALIGGIVFGTFGLCVFIICCFYIYQNIYDTPQQTVINIKQKPRTNIVSISPSEGNEKHKKIQYASTLKDENYESSDLEESVVGAVSNRVSVLHPDDTDIIYNQSENDNNTNNTLNNKINIENKKKMFGARITSSQNLDELEWKSD